jgi:hypothetical protein
MSFLEQLSNTEALPNGIYWLNEAADIETLRENTLQAGFIFFYLDGKRILKEMDFFKQIAYEMLFSGSWGENWESLRNVLVTFFEYEAPNEKGFVLLYDHFQTFAQNEPDRFVICLDVFDIVVNRKSMADKRIIFLLKGDSDKFPNLTDDLPNLKIGSL